MEEDKEKLILELLKERNLLKSNICNELKISERECQNILSKLIKEQKIQMYKIENFNCYRFVNKNTISDFGCLSSKEKTAVIETSSLIEQLSENEVVDFLAFLQKTPFLALRNELGIKIYKNLLDVVKNHTIELEVETDLFHSRKNDGQMKFTSNEMWEAPFNTSGLGRFNFCGVSSFYTAESEDVAIKELKLSDNENFTVMKMTTKRKFKFFDMTYSNCHLFQYCKQKKNQKTSSKEYIIPNFIAQSIISLINEKQIDIDGIKYESTRSDKGDCCYVFFDINKSDFDTEII